MLIVDKDFLQRKVNRNSIIVSELKNSQAWSYIVEDFNLEKQRIDDSWAVVSDPANLQELRITKLAIMQILNMASAYEHDLKVASEQLEKADDEEALAQVNYGDK